jgi:hypothetical protein
MTSLSDTLTVGLVLVLLFGSIALYLYTRIQQTEQKISLLETILLDLKMSSEIKSYSELPATEISEMKGGNQSESNAEYRPFDDNSDDDDDVYPGAIVGSSSPIKNVSPATSETSSIHADEEVIDYKNVIAEAVKSEDTSKVSANYEAMTIKELQTLAKTRGITGAGSMKKGAVIEALKTSDRSSAPVEPGSLGASSFLETSSSFPGSESE